MSEQARAGRQQAPATGRTRRFALAGLVGAAVLGTGISFVLANPLDLGKDLAESPAEVLPADAVGYAEIDLEPGLGEQAEALGFALKVPSLRSALRDGERTDPRRELWQRLASQRCRSELDFQQDLAPWLGESAGVALQLGASVPVVALQTTDEDLARRAATGLARCSDGELAGSAITRGYLVLAADQATADAVVAATGTANLAGSERFSADMTKVGTRGFASWWATRAGLQQLDRQGRVPQQIARQLPELPLVSTGGTLRLAEGNPEVRTVAKLTVELKTSQNSTAVGDLPQDTSLAVGLSEGGIAVDEAWPWLQDSIGRREGLRLPQDARTALGRDGRVSVGPREADGSWPWAWSSYADRGALADVLHRAGGSPRASIVAGTPKVPIAATLENVAWARHVSQTKDKLATDGRFKAAVAKPEQAQFALYANLDQLEPVLRERLDGADPADLAALQAAGLTAHVEDANYLVAVARLTAP